MVLTYLHLLDPEIPIEIWEIPARNHAMSGEMLQNTEPNNMIKNATATVELIKQKNQLDKFLQKAFKLLQWCCSSAAPVHLAI